MFINVRKWIGSSEAIAGFIRVFSVIFVILISPPNPGKPIIQKSVTVVTKNVVLDPLNLVGALN